MDKAERFRTLIEPLHDRVLAFARCLCRSISDGDDLFQEAMLRAFTKLHTLRDDQAFRAWVYRIVISVHRSRARRSFWRRLLPLGADDTPEDDADPAHSGSDYRSESWSPDAADANRRARSALAKLPAVQREAIVLFEIEGWHVVGLEDAVFALHPQRQPLDRRTVEVHPAGQVRSPTLKRRHLEYGCAPEARHAAHPRRQRRR